MRVIPVIDVLNGLVVRAVRGDRRNYRPLVSRLTSSTEPGEVARALLDATASSELYLADLDAILTRQFAPKCHVGIGGPGVAVWADLGIRSMDDAHQIANAGLTPVVGLETADGPDSAAEIVRTVPHAVFSIDLVGGRLMRTWSTAQGDRAIGVARTVIDAGYRRIIVLDLEIVGSGSGVRDRSMIESIRQIDRTVDLVVGGGVRGHGDLEELAGLGVNGALVATALHDGSLSRE